MSDRFGFGDDFVPGLVMAKEQPKQYLREKAALAQEIARVEALMCEAGVDPDDPLFGLEVIGNDDAEDDE